MELALVLAHADPAGGAPVEDLVAATFVAAAAAAGVAVLAIAHRTGRTRVLSRSASLAARVSGLPAWAALPTAITLAALLVAVFGFYWDVATHIDNGRDPGPFANPAHFLIIFGLGGIALAGIVSVLIGSDQTATSVRIRRGWDAPLGGVVLAVCGGIAVLGFPLDDVWHRLFGQDVTLWSPTHVQMVGGAALSTLALWILVTEGRRAGGGDGRWFRRLESLIAGAFLVGLSALHAEFDYSVPQFRLLYHPVLVMGSAGAALVAARVRLGRGGALEAVAVFIVLRGALSLAVGPLMGHTTLHFPLYVVEAIAVEAAGWRGRKGRDVAFGAVSGLAIGTVGLAAEWGWSHVWMTIPWGASLLPEGVILGLVAAVAGGALGGYIGRALSGPHRDRAARAPAGLLTAAALLVVYVYPFITVGHVDAEASVFLRPVEGRHGRWVRPTVAVRPPHVADDAEWFNVTAWQGGGSVVSPLEQEAPGTYTTSDPIPVYGGWKALVRLHNDRSLSAVPIYLPEDEAIPAPEVPADRRFRRAFVDDKRIILREAKDVSPAVTAAASAGVSFVAVSWLVTLVWAMRRLSR